MNKKQLRIASLERMQSSRNGNPKYRVQFQDGTSATTATDTAIAYGITNPEYRGKDVMVTFDSRGHIVNVEEL